MIRGTVSQAGEPLVELELVAPNGAGMQISFLVDTGFNGSLALTRELLLAFGTRFEHGGHFELADGTTITKPSARVDVR